MVTTAAVGVAQAQSYKVIVNEGNGVEKLSEEQISDMLLKKVTKWEDGQKIVPVDLEMGSELRETFSKDVHGKSVAAIKAYWQKKIFTGKGIPPVEKSGDQEVIEFVKNNSGAIGYISSRSSASGVKVIDIGK
jgi:ABC-type phosphate transport system substrate-binding protein